jgi:hypothetical protein
LRRRNSPGFSPLHPAWYLYGIGEAHYGARQDKQAIARLRAEVNRFPRYEKVEDLEHYLAGLRKAGLPEEVH